MRAGENVQVRAADYERGCTLVTRGTRITPPLQAALLAAGVSSVRVYRRLRIGIAASSHEAIPVFAPIHSWMRPDCTGPYIQSLMHHWGYDVPAIERVSALSNARMAAARRAAHDGYCEETQSLLSRYDLIIGYGMPADSILGSYGVGGQFSFPTGRTWIDVDSTSDHRFSLSLSDDRTPPDSVKRPIYRAGASLPGWERVTTYDRAVVLALPGFTPEIAVVMHVFVRRIVDLMEGVAQPAPAWRTGVLGQSLTRYPNRHRWLWSNARPDNDGQITLVVDDGQHAQMMSSFVRGNGLIGLPAGSSDAKAGDRVWYICVG